MECKEAFLGGDGFYLYVTKSENRKSHPFCTKLKSDAYYVSNAKGEIWACGEAGANCPSGRCTFEFEVSSWKGGHYSTFVTCEGGCYDHWYTPYAYGGCSPAGGDCSKVAGDGKNGGSNSHNGKIGFYCERCYSGYTLIKDEGRWGITTKCCK